jgi:hypothetical protein
MDSTGWLRCLIAGVYAVTSVGAQVIEFDSGGLRYQTLTHNGLTIMVAQLPSNIREYSILQVTVSNGGLGTWTVRPEDFIVERPDGSQMPAMPARAVVNNLMEKASRNDVIKLVTAYEHGIFGNQDYKGTNGFEQRRQSALAETSTKVKAAAAASAIAFVQTKLAPGQSTDGAVFYATAGKPIGAGLIRIRAANSVYEFPVLAAN